MISRIFESSPMRFILWDFWITDETVNYAQFTVHTRGVHDLSISRNGASTRCLGQQETREIVMFTTLFLPEMSATERREARQHFTQLDNKAECTLYGMKLAHHGSTSVMRTQKKTRSKTRQRKTTGFVVARRSCDRNRVLQRLILA